MTLFKKTDPQRMWRSFRWHAELVFEAFLVSTIITLFWYRLWQHGYHLAADDKDLIVAALAFFGVTYSLSISWITIAVWGKYQKVVTCVMKKKKMGFLRYRDERMPIALHLNIGFVSLPLLAGVALAPYKQAATGAFMVFSVTAIICLFWVVLSYLEDPMKSAWIRERVPNEWREADIDEVFELDPEHLRSRP